MSFLRVGAALSALVLAACASQRGSDEKPHHHAELKGTAWQLIEIQWADDQVTRPDEPSKYTLEFGADGHLTARVDCNRGSGTWKAKGAGDLELGPLTTTRAMCPPGSLHDRFLLDLGLVDSYVTEDGRLFLNLTGGGGVYVFEPASEARSEAKPSEVE